LPAAIAGSAPRDGMGRIRASVDERGCSVGNLARQEPACEALTGQLERSIIDGREIISHRRPAESPVAPLDHPARRFRHGE
jgi:hypothetical protein